MKYYFLLITILEADLRYNNNINIVYNDTDDVVTRGVPSLKKILDIRTSNYKKILVLKHFY